MVVKLIKMTAMQSHDIGSVMSKTIEMLAEKPVPDDEDIIVRERVRTRRALVLVVDVSGSMKGERIRTAAARHTRHAACPGGAAATASAHAAHAPHRHASSPDAAPIRRAARVATAIIALASG